MKMVAKRVPGLVLALVLLSPPAARAYTLGFGFGGGGAFPLSNYIKAIPPSNSGGNTVYGLSEVKNGPGWNVHAELLVIGMEIRYTWQVYTWKSIKDDQGNPVSTKGLPWLQFHSLTLGYRWYLVNSAFKLYIPIGGGAAFVTFNDVDKLKGQYGFTLYTGLELEYSFLKAFSIGLGARYNFYLTNKPTELIEGKIADNLTNQVKSGQNPNLDLKVKDVVAMFHAISVNLTFTIAF